MKKLLIALLALSLATALMWRPTSAKTAVNRGEEVSVVILGGGMGGLTSALYLGRAGLAPVVLEGDQPGGLITQSANVQNWPGELMISGGDLADRLHRQAEENGAILLADKAVRVDLSHKPFLIETESGRLLQTEACIIAMGTEPNHLGVPGEQEFWGRGVSNCAICDGSLYRDRIVGVVGGGDAAVQEALYLSNLAKEVFVFVRSDHLRATDRERVSSMENQSNVHILYNTSVEAIQGPGGILSTVTLKSDGEEREQCLDGLFLAIGSRPNTELLKGQLSLSQNGYVEIKDGQRTSITGVYAIGDISDPFYKQAVSAAGEGAKAALEVQKLLAGSPVHRLQTAPKRSGTIEEITQPEQLSRELQESDTPILIDFYATWCGPCKRISPLLEHSAGELVGKVKFLKVNVDESEALSRTYAITSMPTVLLLSSKGEVLERKVGTQQISTLLSDLVQDSE